MEIKTALVVDDEEMIRVLLEKILARIGYRVILAEDGREVVKIYARRQDKIHLAVIDLLLPGLSGEETAEYIRTCGEDVAILLTGGRRPSPTKMSSGPADGFLAKPFRLQALIDAVEKVEKRRLEIVGRGENQITPAAVFSVIS
ncbi:MAG: response regulator [FCB group bacterium]|nr:response regulator [FCB group bacterium]